MPFVLTASLPRSGPGSRDSRSAWMCCCRNTFEHPSHRHTVCAGANDEHAIDLAVDAGKVRPGQCPQSGACLVALLYVQLEHPPVDRERVAAFQREPLRYPRFIKHETHRHGRGILRVPAHHTQQRRPRFFAIRANGYGMLIDIGQSFHIEGMY